MKIVHKIYKPSSEYDEYLECRFPRGRDPGTGSFLFKGHRWKYEYTSFDDKGDFALIYRFDEKEQAESTISWIDVEKELPELEEIVLAGWFDGKGEFCWGKYVRVYSDDADGWLWCMVTDYDEWEEDDYQITHWCQVPKLPERNNEME